MIDGRNHVATGTVRRPADDLWVVLAEDLAFRFLQPTAFVLVWSGRGCWVSVADPTQQLDTLDIEVRARPWQGVKRLPVQLPSGDERGKSRSIWWEP